MHACHAVGLDHNCKSMTLLQIVLMGLIESYRANGGIDEDQGLDKLYPGGDYFDPLGLADDPDAFAERRVSCLLPKLPIKPETQCNMLTMCVS